ncbi:hypothetical protein HPP92_005391 [Vanilla planifolia]|nr:hypothetical protein HPP92_005391 [Vanilla planifolia]
MLDMDRRTWLWRRKSLEKSPGDSESSGSSSSFSERCLDEQTAEVSSINESNAVNATVKSLTEKLSAALLDVTTNEDLVKQHAKVAEEAVSGWEMAEAEVSALKQQLEASSQKNSALEDRIGHLEEAFEECARQLRQSMEEQEQKAQDALTKTHELESIKSQLEKQLEELYTQLEIAKSEALIPNDASHGPWIETLEEEKESLKAEILVLSEQLHLCTLERELIIQAAESASRQHLESRKKVTMLESECRRLHAVACRASSKHQRPIASSVAVECLTNSQPGSIELLPGEDGEQVIPDSWQTALTPEFYQFKDVKACARDIMTSQEFELMDDFLEMERLVALPGTVQLITTNNFKGEAFAREESPRNEHEALQLQLTVLNDKVEKMENEKVLLEMALTETQNQLEASCIQLNLAGEKMVDLLTQLDLANEKKQAAIAEVVSMDIKRKEMVSQVEAAHSEIMSLRENVDTLQRKVDGMIPLEELNREIENLKATRKEWQTQLNSACLEAEELRGQVGLLNRKVEEERALSLRYLTNAEEIETARKQLGTQLILANSEIEELNQKFALLEHDLKEERQLSATQAARAKAAEAERSSLESKLGLTNSEIGRVHNEMQCLREKLDKEKQLAAEYNAKFQVLEDELSRRKDAAELCRISSSNGALKLNKDKELAVAAGKLAECQKTIASLGEQLKSLTTINYFISEAEKREIYGCLPCLSSSETIRHRQNGSLEDSDFPPLPHGEVKVSPTASPTALSLPGLVRLLPLSRSNCVENQ